MTAGQAGRPTASTLQRPCAPWLSATAGLPWAAQADEPLVPVFHTALTRTSLPQHCTVIGATLNRFKFTARDRPCCWPLQRVAGYEHTSRHPPRHEQSTISPAPAPATPPHRWGTPPITLHPQPHAHHTSVHTTHVCPVTWLPERPLQQSRNQ